MPEDKTVELVRAFFDCGSYEAGHKFINEHAAEITGGFVAALRTASMQELTTARELAPVFARLAFVAAAALGDDREKGLSLYCEGSVLARLDKHRAALGRYREAETYLRRVDEPQLLANCLYDQAISHRELGEADAALTLLQEALQYQTTDQQRADTRAFMLVLSANTGRLNTEEGIARFIQQTFGEPRRQEMRFRLVVDDEETRRLCEQLAAQHPAAGRSQLFRDSLPHFVANPDYRFFVAETGSDAVPAFACGLATNYRDMFNDVDLLGVEALCFSEFDVQGALDVIEQLRRMAGGLRMQAVCISEATFGEAAFRMLLGHLGLEQLPLVPMQGMRPGLYSAFTTTPTGPGSFARCLRIAAPSEPFDFDGQLAAGDAPLYRGEGRLRLDSARASWDFGARGRPSEQLKHLAQHIFEHGFRGRVHGRFAGTIHAQLLHQGYVEQPTVSLSESADVCASYATDRYTREIGGVVFKIDRRALQARGGVYDSVGTLNKACPWMAGRFHDTIVKLMAALDGGHHDVRESGAFLARCHAESRRRVEVFGGGELGPGIDWPAFVGAAVFRRLRDGGVSTSDLDAINRELEGLWRVALGQMIGMDEIDRQGGSRSVPLSRAYFQAFDDVCVALKERWTLNEFSRYNHPGWDLSPLGYVVKTLRDEEFFSNGDVPGDCIAEARIVDKSGQAVDVLANR